MKVLATLLFTMSDAAAAAAAAAGGASWQEAFEEASAADALSQLLDAAVEKMTDLTTPFSLPLDATIKLCREKRAAVGREGWTAEVAVKFGVLVKLIRAPPAPTPLRLAPVLRGHDTRRCWCGTPRWGNRC